jgi:hypothetical protein
LFKIRVEEREREREREESPGEKGNTKASQKKEER